MPAQEGGGDSLSLRILTLRGLVQVRASEADQWQMARVGQQFGLGAEFRTGPRSAVQFSVGDTQVVSLDRLGVVKVVDALRSDERISTDLGLNYGRAELEVQAGGLEHESQIRSPGATLAVRGSRGGLSDNIGYPAVGFVRDKESFFKAHGDAAFVRLEEEDVMDEQDQSPVDRRLAVSSINPTENANTSTENQISNLFPSGSFDLEQSGALTSIDEVNANKFEAIFVEDFLTGPPDFVGIGETGEIRGQLVWDIPTDLDLHLILPTGEQVFFANPLSEFFVQPFDATGVAELDVDITGGVNVDPNLRVENLIVNRREGSEFLPPGEYTFFVRNFSGSVGTEGTLTVQAGDLSEVLDFTFDTAGQNDSDGITVTIPANTIGITPTPPGGFGNDGGFGDSDGSIFNAGIEGSFVGEG
ncbi:MAG: hypothetical protein ACFB21_08725 [Opitutales bacterium]